SGTSATAASALATTLLIIEWILAAHGARDSQELHDVEIRGSARVPAQVRQPGLAERRRRESNRVDCGNGEPAGLEEILHGAAGEEAHVRAGEDRVRHVVEPALDQVGDH